MTIEQVIKKGEFSFFESVINSFLSFFQFGVLGIIDFLLLILILILFGFLFLFPLFILFEKKPLIQKLDAYFESDSRFRKINLFMLFFFPGTIMATLFAGFFLTNLAYGPYVDEWKEQSVLPFLESIESDRFTLQDFDNETERKTTSFIHRDSFNEDLFESKLVYLDNEGKTRSFYSEAVYRYTLSEGEIPYIEMKELTQNIGHGLNAGYYNPVVYLPMNYSLSYSK